VELGGAVGNGRRAACANGAGWWCLFGSFLVLMPTARAGEWQIDPFVEVQAIATDNVNGASGSRKDSDLVTRFTGGVVVSGIGRRARLNLNYALTHEVHLDHSELDDTSQHLAAIGNVEVIKDSIFVDGRASISRESIDRTGEVSATDRNTGSNQRDVYVYSISPYWRHRYAGFAESELRLTRSQSFTSTPDSSRGGRTAGTATDTESNGASVLIASGTDFTRLLWRLSGSANESKRDRGTLTSLNADGTVQYNLNEDFGLLGTVGIDDIDDAGLTEDVSGPYALGGFIWAPSDRTHLRFQAGWRYNDISFSGDARYDVTARTTFVASYSESVGLAIDQFLGALGSTEIDPRGRFVDRLSGQAFTGRGIGGLPLTDNLTLTKEFRAGIRTAWTRDSINLSYSHVEQDVITDDNPGTITGPGLRKSDGVTFNYSHQLTPLMSSFLTLSYSESYGKGGDGSSDQTYRATLGVNYLFSDTLTGSLSYSFLRREESGGGTAAGTGDITENAIVATLRKSF
jgi:uncharacterized protein (PEP-CTERM system associated)